MSYIQDIDTETTRLQFYAVFTGIASRFQVDVLAWNCIRVSSRFTDSKVKWRIPTANFPSGPVLKSARLSSRASDSTSADQRTRLIYRPTCLLASSILRRPILAAPVIKLSTPKENTVPRSNIRPVCQRLCYIRTSAVIH